MKAPTVGQLLDQPAERERVLAHDPKLLRTWSVVEEGVETEHYQIRREYVLEKYAAFVDALAPCTGDQLDKIANGVHVSQAADHIWGSRDPGYVQYLKKDGQYGGPVDTRLADGHHCHIDSNGILFRTATPEAIEDLFVAFSEGQGDAANRATERAVNNIERVKALSARRVPVLKEALEDHTSKTQVTMQAGILAKLKALEPPKRK